MAWHDLVPHTNNYSTAGKFTPSFRDVIFFIELHDACPFEICFCDEITP